jgi:hypothetical protein
MIKVKDPNKLYFEGMDPWGDRISERKLQLLKNSWAEIFRVHVLPKLPVKHMTKYFSKTMGRPTKELTAMCGACVLQQFFDLTDEETRDQLAFNQQWHYALNLLDIDDQVISLKTLWSCRYLLVHDDLAKPIFDSVANKLADAYQIDKKFQRLDSVHIHSNMARLGRIRLLSRVCTNFLKNLKRHHPDLYATVSDTIIARYSKIDDDPDYFGNSRPTESQKRLEDIAADLYELISQFKGTEQVQPMHTYMLLQRVFKEQCNVDNDSVSVKPAKEISSESLQNPSDVDATYDGHKGQGYQVQIMETYSKDDSDDDPKQESLQLITYVNVEQAHCHDSDTVEDALNDTEERNLLPEELTADTLYGGKTNIEKAKEHHVKLVTPIPGKKPKNNLSSFEFDETTGELKSCPQGNSPNSIKHNKKGSISCIWNKTICANCAYLSECSVQACKKGYRLRYTPEEAEAAIRRQYEQSHEFKDKYRYRSGIEASISRYIHQTGARRSRYRGLKRVSYAARLKAVGINVFRAARFALEQREQACLA